MFIYVKFEIDLHDITWHIWEIHLSFIKWSDLYAPETTSGTPCVLKEVDAGDSQCVQKRLLAALPSFLPSFLPPTCLLASAVHVKKPSRDLKFSWLANRDRLHQNSPETAATIMTYRKVQPQSCILILKFNCIDWCGTLLSNLLFSMLKLWLIPAIFCSAIPSHSDVSTLQMPP